MKKILVLIIVCALSVGTMFGLNFIENIPYRELVYAGISALYLIAGCIFLRLSTRKMSTVKYLSLKPLRLRDTFIVVWMLLGIISGSYLLTFLEIRFWALFDIEMTVSSFSGMSVDNVWMMIIAVGVIPAIFEELFFRGAVLSSFKDNGTVVALLVSGLFFFLLHGTPFGSLSAIFAGMSFGLLTLVTGSVFAAMLAHLINNMLTYILHMYSEKLSVVGLENMVVYALIFVFLLSAYAALSCIYKKFKKESVEKVTVYNEGELVWKNQRRSKGKGAKD